MYLGNYDNLQHLSLAWLAPAFSLHRLEQSTCKVATHTISILIFISIVVRCLDIDGQWNKENKKVFWNNVFYPTPATYIFVILNDCHSTILISHDSTIVL